METLLEDYKRKLKTAESMIESGITFGNEQANRVKIKRSLYRSMIVDIERAVARVSNENSGFNIPVVSGSLCGFARVNELMTGCTVYMNSSSGCVGYGNIQCVSGVCEPFGEISLYGHNQNYRIDDIKEIVSYPIVEL